MQRILTETYSTFYHVPTHTQFEKCLDRRSGCFVAVAVVSDAKAEAFADNQNFRIIEADEWEAMNHLPEPQDIPATSGDPLQDAALGAEPPAPPKEASVSIVPAADAPKAEEAKAPAPAKKPAAKKPAAPKASAPAKAKPAPKPIAPKPAAEAVKPATTEPAVPEASAQDAPPEPPAA